MTAAIPVTAEKVASGRLASTAVGNSGSVQQAKKTLTGTSGTKHPKPKSGPDSIPAKKGSRVSTPKTSSNSGSGHGRGAGPLRRTSPSKSGRAMQPHVRILVAEWVLAVLLIGVTVPSERGGKGYADMMGTMMLRLTGLTGIFFALSLIGTVQRAARFAIWFGFLIDLGIIYHATTSGSSKALASIFTGKSVLSTSGGATLAADFHDTSTPPQPTPYGGGVGASSSGTGGASANSGGASFSPGSPIPPGVNVQGNNPVPGA